MDAGKLETILACPVCRAKVEVDGESRQVTCVGCGRRYPVVDGIPVMIADRAEKP